MNPRHNQIAPLNTGFINSTRFPSRPPSNGGGRGGMRRPRQRSLPPVLPYPQMLLTRPPMGFPMYQPSSPVFSSGSLPPMSPAPSWLPCYQPAPVVNYNAALPPPPFTRPTTSVGSSVSLPPRNAHRRGNSDNVSGLSELRIHSRPTEMPVGVMPNEAVGVMPNEAGDVMNVLLTDCMDPDKIFYVYSEDDSEIIFRDSGNEKSSGSENRREATSGHNEFGLSDSKHGKRILANEESYAPSNAKKARRSDELDEQEQIEQLTGEDPRLKLGTGEIFLDDSLLNIELDPSMLQMLNELDQLLPIDLDFDEKII